MDDKLSLVSVIVNCYNSQAFLKECIESILNQIYFNFEIIFIDNQSTDGTSQIIKSYKDSRIYYFKTPHFMTLGGARNIGLNHAKGDYISFLDSDDIWDKKKLLDSIPLLKKKKGLVYSDVIYFNETKNFNLYGLRKPYQGNCFEELIEDYTLCLSSCIFSKNIIKKNKIKFNEKLMVCEDFDFFLKIALKTKITFLDKKLVKYRIHNQNLTKTKRYLFFDEIRIIVNEFQNINQELKDRVLSKNLLNEAKYDWKLGKNTTGRSKIILNKELKLFQKIFYLTLFFIPFRFISKIYNLLFKRVLF
jgi:glycosyltransferase involved in cell wall biosynthesis